MNKTLIKKIENSFKSIVSYDNAVDFIDRILIVYSLIKSSEYKKKDVSLRPFEREKLNYYIRYGYSKDTKDKIAQELGKTHNNIRQTDRYLEKKGYLKRGKKNYNDLELSEELERLRDSFISGDNKFYILKFERRK